MTNFAIPVAMKCTERQFRDSWIKGVALQKKLEELGYDFSQHNFYPNKPYLTNFYKRKPRLICTTATPYTVPNINVYDQWNEHLFYALCCQRETSTVMVDEFFSILKTGEIRQCTGLDGEYVRTEVIKGKGSVFKREEIEKVGSGSLEKFYGVSEAIFEEEVPELKASPESIEEILSTIKKTGMLPPVESKPIQYTLTPHECFQAMMDKKKVFVGKVNEDGVTSKCGTIIRMDSVSVTIDSGDYRFTDVYPSIERFLTHGLVILAQSENK